MGAIQNGVKMRQDTGLESKPLNLYSRCNPTHLSTGRQAQEDKSGTYRGFVGQSSKSIYGFGRNNV